MPQALIVGGGISGLSAAYYLTRLGVRPTLIDRNPKLGGVIQTEVVNGCVIEGGPDSFLAAKPWAMDLIRELGLESEVIGSNDHLRVTYIWKRGRMVPMPDGLMMMVPTRIWPMVTTSLLSWPTKIRMGLEWFRHPASDGGQDRSVADFIRDHYGQETVDYLAEPLLAGVFGGDPGRLSVVSVLTRFAELEKRYGSLTRGVLVEGGRTGGKLGGGSLFRTLKGGLGQLVTALEQSLAGRTQILRGEAGAVERSQNGYSVPVNGEPLQTRHLILACPAHEASGMLASVDAELSQLLGGIGYSSSMTLALGYPRHKIAHKLNGFGFLVPKKERRRLVACTWVGTKFSHRVPDSHVLLRCFLGGASGEAALLQPDGAIVASVREELREMMGIAAEPEIVRISRWPRSMAQYEVGHAARVQKIEQRLKLLPGLHLAGNAYYGIGLPDCIRLGKQAAESAAGLPLRIDY
ncbi:MAG: protoporphyrinogen oxidase [Acidobacteriia bacterium]|nr:protoporphyrinogen oxidase [Terriglobia bacterium]